MCDVGEMKLRVKCQTPQEPVSVFVVWKKKGQLGVCKHCWEKIADKNWECGDAPRISVKELFSDKARGLEGAVLTVYKPKEIKKGEEVNEEELY